MYVPYKRQYSRLLWLLCVLSHESGSKKNSTNNRKQKIAPVLARCIIFCGSESRQKQRSIWIIGWPLNLRMTELFNVKLLYSFLSNFCYESF